MSLQSRITDLAQAIGLDIKLLKAQVDTAAGLWEVTTADPPNPAIGAPWLLEKTIAPEAPIGVLLAGFGSDILYEPIAPLSGFTLSVKTTSGIARATLVLDQ
jgi:hypothetical protein